MHRGELGITGNADHSSGVSYTHANGQPFTLSGATPVTGVDPEELCPPIGTYRPPSGERLEADNVYFNPPWVQPKWRGIYPPPLPQALESENRVEVR